MQRLLVAFITALVFSATTTTAYGSNREDIEQCDAAWLGHNWVQVAVRCSSSAFSYEIDDAVPHSAEADTGDSVDLPLTRSMAFTEYQLCADGYARAAFAYQQLGQHKKALEKRDEAVYCLQHGFKYAQVDGTYTKATDVEHATNLLNWLKSVRFLKAKITQTSLID